MSTRLMRILDLTEPEITGAKLRTENRKIYIDVSVKDNYHISSIRLLENDDEVPVQYHPVAGLKLNPMTC